MCVTVYGGGGDGGGDGGGGGDSGVFILELFNSSF